MSTLQTDISQRTISYLDGAAQLGTAKLPIQAVDIIRGNNAIALSDFGCIPLDGLNYHP
jgi:hypothetical protein